MIADPPPCRFPTNDDTQHLGDLDHLWRGPQTAHSDLAPSRICTRDPTKGIHCRMGHPHQRFMINLQKRQMFAAFRFPSNRPIQASLERPSGG